MPVSHGAYLPTKRSLYTIIGGPEKSRENFDQAIHKIRIVLWECSTTVFGGARLSHLEA
ncbi:hypothetical protein BS47DRAFT_1336153 [Hydnum rufescens UP504]|uniref:Uncharacterized protein n=1 Tax=Hydnum rufescens UP504 TaxID=1448309 RepID=A0A9P6E046_9AGAM|nr:hypothetical protein BS47DRAFT_1336153 [Hydnum rufescens UP504]